MTSRKHVILSVGLFSSAVLSGFLISTWLDSDSPCRRLSGERKVQRSDVAVTSSGNLPINQSSSVSSFLNNNGLGHFSSVKVDSTFNFDYMALRRDVMDSIEWHSINQIPHHFDFWQYLSRDELRKWINVQSEMPEYKIWFQERVYLMSEYSKSTEPAKKAQLLEALNRNQMERIRISELVISLAKAENPSIGTPGNATVSSPEAILKKPKTPPPEQPKLFQ